jgi:hypothetical protein
MGQPESSSSSSSPSQGPPSSTREQQPSDSSWTVTITGSERHDGEGPYIWVVGAPDATTATAVAERHHQSIEEDDDTVVRGVEPGAPTAGYPWVYNDLRSIPYRTVVPTRRHRPADRPDAVPASAPIAACE